VAEQTQIG